MVEHETYFKIHQAEQGPLFSPSKIMKIVQDIHQKHSRTILKLVKTNLTGGICKPSLKHARLEANTSVHPLTILARYIPTSDG